MSDAIRNERNVFLELEFGREINRPWLENTAIEIEEYLENNMSEKVLGPSVTANFENNSFDLHLTVVAENSSDEHLIVGQIVSAIEGVAHLKANGSNGEERTEIRSGVLSCDSGGHEQEMVPA